MTSKNDGPRVLVLDLPRSYAREVLAHDRLSNIDYADLERKLIDVASIAGQENLNRIVIDSMPRPIDIPDIALTPRERGNRHDRRVRAAQKRRKRNRP